MRIAIGRWWFLPWNRAWTHCGKTLGFRRFQPNLNFRERAVCPPVTLRIGLKRVVFLVGVCCGISESNIATTDPVALNQFGTKLKVGWNSCPPFYICLHLPWLH